MIRIRQPKKDTQSRLAPALLYTVDLRTGEEQVFTTQEFERLPLAAITQFTAHTDPMIAHARSEEIHRYAAN